MARIRTLLIGSAVGAAAAYFFDPDLGGARRARLQDELGARVRESRRVLESAARQLQGRAQGAVAELDTAAPWDDDDLTVLSRVESVLYGMPGFPKGAIESEVVDGRLILRGEVASPEQERDIVELASHVRGVAQVESLLRVPGPEAPNGAAAPGLG
ncbi:MAG TPA: BON domain-containing protein [Candidatus Dormibacteraeota bacterium]|nr:BON domain-containing protein [Candidatus Dormibacteraeota bacterium]